MGNRKVTIYGYLAHLSAESFSVISAVMLLWWTSMGSSGLGGGARWQLYGDQLWESSKVTGYGKLFELVRLRRCLGVQNQKLQGDQLWGL
jgi:hypothetical protein